MYKNLLLYTDKINLGVAQLVARYLGVVEAASSSLVTQTNIFGVWLSLVERMVRDHEAASSTLVTPTTKQSQVYCDMSDF